MTQKRPVAFVTGASSGIGFSIAKHLKQHGFVVYAGARRVYKMNDLDDIGIHTLSLDVTDSESIQAAVQQIATAEGRLDVLVNNAGFGVFGAIEEVPLEKAKQQFDVNVFGVTEMSKAVLSLMRERHAGRIINISSVDGKIANPLGGWYVGSKFAVEGLSDSMRLELADFGIQVAVIEPGPIKSDWAKIAGEQLLEVSHDGPYQELSKQAAAFLQTVDAFGAQPEIIARKVVQAATARRPRTRYTAGVAAYAGLLGRRLLPDSALDAVLRQTGKLALRYQERSQGKD
ncbi:oxidoreductase [Secundilactobacillus muriivasis]